VNFNRSAGITRKTVSLTLWAVVFCLISFVSAPAQTYTPNDIYTIAGGGATPATPLDADLPGPTAAIKDSSGNIYIASQDAAYVYKLSSTGTLSVFAGLGFSGYSNDGKKATAALIGGVTGLAIDKGGNIYLADAVGSRIRKVTTAGIISTVAGNGTKCDKSGVCGDGGAATSANLNLPESVAIDGNGIIYIADTTDDRIRAVNTTSATVVIAGVSIPSGDIATIAGNGTACPSSQNACGDGGVATSAMLNLPNGVAVDGAGDIFIADTKDQRIREVAAGQSNITTFAGNGLPCTNPVSGCGDGLAPASARLYLPKGVATAPNGDVYIADTNANRIRYIASGSNVITTVVDSTGMQGYAGNGGAATAAAIDFPVGIFADASGNLLVSDTGNQVVREVTAGTTPTIATIAGGGMGGDGGSPTSGTLALPWGVAEDAQGNLYIADQGNNRIRKITNPGKSSAMISTYAGTGSAGYSGDNGAATLATLNGPTSVALDSNGNLYIADSNNLVIREVYAATGDIATVLGNGLPCVPATALCGDQGPALSANLTFPLMVTLDSQNNVYVSDYQGYKVRKWNVAKNVVTTVAGNGLQGYQGNGKLGNAARVNHPAGVVVDNSDDVIFSDQWNDVVRYVTQPADIINNYALNTLAKFKGDGGPALSASMFNPLALAIGPTNDVYISGGNDNVVQRVSAATQVFSNVAGNASNPAQGGFSGDGGPAINARMENLGAYVDGNNNLYIADGGTNRIRYVPLAPNVTYSATSLSMGQWALGATGAQKPLTLTGAGGLDLQISDISISGANMADFAQTNNCGTLPALLSPQATCTVEVTLTPSQFGEETATLNFTDNATGSTQQSVTLTGYGPDFTIADLPNTLTVAAGSSGTSTVTLTPQAKFAKAIALSCPTGLPTGATCSFQPASVQLYGGSAQTSTLTIQTSSTTPAGTYTVTVMGTYASLANPSTITLTVQ